MEKRDWHAVHVFSLMASEGIESYLMFDDDLSCSALRPQFTVPFSRFIELVPLVSFAVNDSYIFQKFTLHIGD